MHRILVLAMLLVFAAHAGDRSAAVTGPSYSASSIVNAGNFQPQLAPNTLVTIFGAGLSFVTQKITNNDIGSNGLLPCELGNVRVYVAGTCTTIYYVSDEQINFLMPPDIVAGSIPLWVVRQGIAGPIVNVRVDDTAPALFHSAEGSVSATHADGRPVDASAPARPGEIVVLYGTGLGRVVPDQIYRFTAPAAAPLRQISDFRVVVGAQTLERSSIIYAGVSPGFAGLYQMNIQLPADMPLNPAIQVGFDGRLSSKDVTLPTQ